MTAARAELTDAQKAQQQYRRSLLREAGPMTGKELGDAFGKSDRWGRNQIAEVSRWFPGETEDATSAATSARNSGDPERNSGPVVVSFRGPGDTPTADHQASAAAPELPLPLPRNTSAEVSTSAEVPLPVPEVRAEVRAEVVAGPDGRRVARLGFAFGSLISVAANIMAAYIPYPPQGGDPKGWVPPADWAPSPAAVVFAAVWPIALLISVEILSRVKWAKGLQWVLVRYVAAVGVAVGSAVISYSHTHEVLAAWHYSDLGAGVGPLVVDGLMVISGLALLSISHAARGAGGKS